MDGCSASAMRHDLYDLREASISWMDVETYGWSITMYDTKIRSQLQRSYECGSFALKALDFFPFLIAICMILIVGSSG